MNRLHRFFIPSEHNDFRPSSLEARASGVMLLLIMFTFALANVHSLLLVSSDWFVGTIIPAALITLSNDQRQGDALPTLTHNPTLDAAAQLKANDMAEKSYFAHQSPEGRTPWYWFGLAGYDYAYAGENLAVLFSDSEDVVRAWMNSPGHRANILGSHYTEMGIGTAKGMYKGVPTVFVVQFFGTPSKTITPAILVQKPTPKTVIPEPRVLGVQTEHIEVPPYPQENVAALAPRIVTSDTPLPVYRAPVAEAPLHQLAQAVPVVHAAKVQSEESDLATSDIPPGGSVEILPGGGKESFSLSVRIGEILYKILSSPHIIISVIYLLLASVVVCMLAVAIVVEWRKQHPIQIAYAVGLMAVLFCMFSLHMSLTSGALIL